MFKFNILGLRVYSVQNGEEEKTFFPLIALQNKRRRKTRIFLFNSGNVNMLNNFATYFLLFNNRRHYPHLPVFCCAMKSQTCLQSLLLISIMIQSGRARRGGGKQTNISLSQRPASLLYLCYDHLCFNITMKGQTIVPD